ncbi:hypothetical protein K505DRAFT_356799 [Melanomma pulvis-pyrius CBS 109.77]|uniref:Uncharacterized protein n=1 Tax=Melanomma pulvis-pyrius CBS 109.77 TaxID=1314802 RepID=A0A6A6XRY9_9PLEO|nr:hypothetical protein K505DRAFT_356799 [Melanomma pulvis-pyrius CBS 109.77]
MKWEPIYNIVFRYLFCRCIIRLSTPSRLIPEMTLFRCSVCPRHNTQSIIFRDYSELALPSHDDPYFDKFGGYNSFWALLHRDLPNIFGHLCGPQAITSNQLDHGYMDLARIEKKDEDAVRRMLKDYQFEVTEHLVNLGVDLPPDRTAKFAEEKAERQSVKQIWGELVSDQMRTEMRDSPMFKELKEIDEGNWHGIPHWIIED